MFGRSNKTTWLMLCIESLDSSIRHDECQSWVNRALKKSTAPCRKWRRTDLRYPLPLTPSVPIAAAKRCVWRPVPSSPLPPWMSALGPRMSKSQTCIFVGFHLAFVRLISRGRFA